MSEMTRATIYLAVMLTVWGTVSILGLISVFCDAIAYIKEKWSEKLAKHKHTDECLEYAAKTGRAFCITDCRDSYRGEG